MAAENHIKEALNRCDGQAAVDNSSAPEEVDSGARQARQGLCQAACLFERLEAQEAAARRLARRLALRPAQRPAHQAPAEPIDLTADDPDDPYVPGTARPRAYQRFTGAVEPEDIGLEAIEEGAEPADLGSPAPEAASGSAFAGAEGSQDAEFDNN
ncbi:hypothetical protein NHJ13734_004796 [Beauveria thailandica]